MHHQTLKKRIRKQCDRCFKKIEKKTIRREKVSIIGILKKALGQLPPAADGTPGLEVTESQPKRRKRGRKRKRERDKNKNKEGSKIADLLTLYREISSRGGIEKMFTSDKWKDFHEQLV